ncbi:UNVERIFIED_CONTAM: IucA/IucC family protein, partial [Mumia flava]
MQRRSDTAAHTATASAAVAAGNLRLESIPALREAGVRTEHWSTAQQLARRRVLSRLLQALFREALLSADQLIADTRADVTLLPIWQQRVLLRFTGLRPGALGSWTLTGDVAVLAHGRPPTPIEHPSALLHWLAPMLDMGDAAEAHRLAAIGRL